MKDPERKIAIEDLLRLKRAERPPPEFWARFESEMRAKQLAAIVVKRPWWDGASRVFAVVYRHQLPFGAAAALALAFLGVHFVGGGSQVGRVVPSGAARPTAVSRAPAPAAQVGAHAIAQQERVEVGAREAAQPEQPVVASNVSHLTVAPVIAQSESPSGKPFADGIGATLVDFREAGSDLVKRDVFGSDREFEASVASVRQPMAEPMAQLDPSGARLERLLAPALPAYSSSGSRSLSSDRMKQKVSNDRIYESMDRYGTGGMSLEFRF